MTHSALPNFLRKESYVIHLKIVSWIYKQLKNVVLNPKAYSILLEQVQVSTSAYGSFRSRLSYF